SGKVGLSKDIAEEAFGIARDPTIALGDRPFGINRDELIRAILFPDTRQPRRSSCEMVDQCVKGAKRHSDIETAFHPDIEQPRKKARHLSFRELKSTPPLTSRTAGKRRVDLKVRKSEFVSEILIELLGAYLQASLVQNCNDAYVNPGGLHGSQLPCPEMSICVRTAVDQLSGIVRKVHRCSQRALKHRSEDFVP